MVDIKVQEILREIRDHVRAEAPPPLSGHEAPPPSSDEELPRHARLAQEAQSEPQTADLLARLEMHSRTTLRAWDKLPPLTSKRSGLLARLELWFKRQARRATHWYAWEQINFNAAVKEALQDVAAALSNQEREMTGLRHRLEAVTQMKTELASHLSSFGSSLAELESKLAALDRRFVMLDDGLAALPAETPALRDEVRALRTLVTDLRHAYDENFTRLRDEQRASAEQIQDQHRVAFKQLSLEIKESASKSGPEGARIE